MFVLLLYSLAMHFVALLQQKEALGRLAWSHTESYYALSSRSKNMCVLERVSIILGG